MSLDPARKAELEGKLRGFVGVVAGEPRVAPDRVNEAMIRHFCVVIGDENPIYLDADAAKRSVHGEIKAPPAMLNTWVMPPYIPPWALEGSQDASPADKEVELHQLLGRYGYTGVVATNFEDEYHRYLRIGERISATKCIAAISEEKATPLGVGYFIDVRWTYTDERGESVGTELWRVLKYRPENVQAQASASAASAAPTRPGRLRPPLGHDNAWWWEAIERGELRIQRCEACGALRHPPRPMCGSCQSVAWDSVVASGRGTVYSYTVLHHPKVPGYEYPLPVALIELEEGTRIVANLVDCETAEIEIGMAVVGNVEPVEEEMKLPVFRRVK